VRTFAHLEKVPARIAQETRSKSWQKDWITGEWFVMHPADLGSAGVVMRSHQGKRDSLIEQFSTAEDRKSLIEAFKKSGQDGMVKVLEDMKPKGRIRFASGGVGNDIKYIIQLPSEKGRRFRLVTDRTLAFGELYQGTRSRDYTVGAIDLELTPDGKGGTGTVLPACKLTVNKKKQQVEVETYQNPWKLSNFIVSKG